MIKPRLVQHAAAGVSALSPFSPFGPGKPECIYRGYQMSVGLILNLLNEFNKIYYASLWRA